MDFLLLLKAGVIGILEGLTEFLPISSTGHLIVASDAMSFSGPYVTTFEVVIQVGAILALCWELRHTLWQKCDLRQVHNFRFWWLIFLGFIPGAVLGVLFASEIKDYLFSPIPVATAFIVGGILMLWVEKKHATNEYLKAPHRLEDVKISPIMALKIGFLQALALIPGTSRSGASIIGAMWLGVPRLAATEFSFYLALPMLSGAAVYSIIKDWQILNHSQIPTFIVGLITAFASAYLCVRWLLRYVSAHTFIPFAWYRIIVGGVVLAVTFLGIV